MGDARATRREHRAIRWLLRPREGREAAPGSGLKGNRESHFRLRSFVGAGGCSRDVWPPPSASYARPMADRGKRERQEGPLRRPQEASTKNYGRGREKRKSPEPRAAHEQIKAAPAEHSRER